MLKHTFIITILALCALTAAAQNEQSVDSAFESAMQPLHLPSYTLANPSDANLDTLYLQSYSEKFLYKNAIRPTIYELPYSFTGRCKDWKRLWVNTATLTGAFVGTLLVLECLPEDATSWNRAALQKVPLGKRWVDHVLKQGPEIDHDLAIFNYVLHPYAGAVYYMGARSAGFNVWQSLLYSTIISDVGWEFGIEAFMERPSYQDLFITPLVGSAIGEGFYLAKRALVAHDYRILGSPVLGGIVAFLIDPVNEFTGLFIGNPARRVAHREAMQRSGIQLTMVPGYKSLTLTLTF